MNTLGRTVRALAAAAAILGLLVGVPAALWHVAGRLLDGRLLLALEPGGSVLEVLTSPDDGTLLIAFLVAVGAIAWLMLAVSLVGELVAVVTRRPTARLTLPGLRWSSGIAAALVSAVLGAGPAVAAPALAADTTLLAATPSDTSWTRPGPTGPRPADPAQVVPAPGQDGTGPVHVVERRDSLWRIAETVLGDPLRWREIYDLNAGREQPDGGRLTEASLLTVGWRLELPHDARVAIRVAPGDTLTGLAAEHLGDPALADRLFDLNSATPQPGGAALTDPDLIRPGWTLSLPVPTADPPVPAAPQPPPGRTSPGRAEPEEGRATDPTTRPAPAPPAPELLPGPTDGENATDGSGETGTPDDGATGGATADAGRTDGGSDTVDEAPMWALAAGGVSALVAGGAAVSLALHRRRQLRHRPPRYRIAVPDDDHGQLEWSLHHPEPADEATRTAARHLDLALRCLTAPDQPADALPTGLRTIRLTDTDALVTTTGEEGLPAPFAPTGEAHRWVLDAETPLPLTDAAAAGLCAPYPILVSIGTDGARTLMIDLEERRLLRLGGDPDRCTALLRHLAAELATSATAEDTEILLVGLDDDLAALNPDQVVVTDLASALTEIDHRARATRAALVRHHLYSVVDGRRRNLAPDAWLPTVLLVAHSLDADEHALLDAVDLTDSAVAVVVLDSGDPALTVDPTGVLHLDDVGDGPWTAATLATRAGTRLATLLGTTNAPPEPARPLDHPQPWAAGMDEDGGLSDAAPPHVPYATSPGGSTRLERDDDGDETDIAMSDGEDRSSPAITDDTGRGRGSEPDDAGPDDRTAPDTTRDGDGVGDAEGRIGRDECGRLDDLDLESETGAGPGSGAGDAPEPAGGRPAGVPIPRSPEPAGDAAAADHDEDDRGTDGHGAGGVAVDPQALRRLAIVDHQDPGLDADLAAWRSGEAPAVPMIAILGEPAVRAPGPPPATRTSWFTEVLVYLSLHPTGVTAQQAAADLWPDGHRISPATIRHAFYGARRWAGRGLGGDASASFVSDMAHDSTYRLRGHLLDWDLFRRLRKRAQARRAAAHPGAAADYEAALSLIRGPVLTALRPGGYAWLNNHDQRHDLQIPGFLVDTAHELVDLALAGGYTATARRAAERARAVDLDVAFDRPLTDLMRIAHAEDNRSELELYAAVLLDARGFDVPEELAPDSFAVLHELLPHGPRRTAP
ncbi:MAG: LysM peptidoglycan-binding domain-containing protein [Pseudonocardiales bacterium]|nr:LysM peptidoglycan-binding domain-containing protein [Pseudonocardiales bacterium]